MRCGDCRNGDRGSFGQCRVKILEHSHEAEIDRSAQIDYGDRIARDFAASRHIASKVPYFWNA
jgi:hypothetical protein